MKRFLRGLYFGDYDVDVPIGKTLFVVFMLVLLVVAFVLLLVKCTALQ